MLLRFLRRVTLPDHHRAANPLAHNPTPSPPCSPTRTYRTPPERAPSPSRIGPALLPPQPAHRVPCAGCKVSCRSPLLCRLHPRRELLQLHQRLLPAAPPLPLHSPCLPAH